LDRAPSSLSALARISDRLKGRVPLILDSGVRRGTDMLIARALGATMVATGRAVLYGATDGERGAGQVLDILKEELILAMKLSGQPDISAVTRELVRTDSLP
ncbi:MAG: alpha-hydroxy-acid oxidizing protein, partial [Pseudomonadota bacterium]